MFFLLTRSEMCIGVSNSNTVFVLSCAAHDAVAVRTSVLLYGNNSKENFYRVRLSRRSRSHCVISILASYHAFMVADLSRKNTV